MIIGVRIRIRYALAVMDGLAEYGNSPIPRLRKLVTDGQSLYEASVN